MSYYNLGRRFVAEKEHGKKVHSKPARRMLRRRARQQASRIETSLAKARLKINAARDLGENSHERRRFVQALNEANAS